MLQAVTLVLLTLAAGSAPAELPDTAPILTAGQLPALCGPAPAQPAAKGGFDPPVWEQATCTADCDPYTDVSCSGNQCTAVNRNCSAGQRGYVVCDGAYHFCPICPCEEGTLDFVGTGNCCDCYQSGGEETDVYKCINGVWVYQRTRCFFASPNCPICP